MRSENVDGGRGTRRAAQGSRVPGFVSAWCCTCLLWVFFPVKSFADDAPYGKVRLFGTIEFRSKLKETPQWERVVAEERKKPGLDSPVGLAASWPTTRDALKEKTLLEKLNGVNKFFNRYPYRLDEEIYGIRNYWSTPAEFMKNSGDCKDYSIIKYYALKQLGVNPDSMRIVVLTDAIRNLAHAVVAVYYEGDAYILDNMSNLVLPHTRLTHYRPQFSVNEKYRWAHMAPKKQ
jgi:predicted transglutaminase-like cysteine proteinase